MWVYIYTAEQEWQPWVNTLAYYPLESNGNDFSWNNNNLTTFNWITFGTLSSWKEYAIFNGSSSWNSVIAKTNSISFSNSAYTASLWIKPENNWWSYPNQYHLFNIGTWQVNFRLITSWYGKYTPATYYNSNQWIIYQSSISPIVDWNWHHFVVTANLTSISLYIDNVLIWTQSGSITSYSWNWVITLWVNPDDTTYYGYKWWMSDVIFEKAIWSEQDRTDYYNLTKSNYWL